MVCPGCGEPFKLPPHIRQCVQQRYERIGSSAAEQVPDLFRVMTEEDNKKKKEEEENHAADQPIPRSTP